MKEHYDVVCIGAGPGGYTAAIRAAQLGKKVAVVELSRERVGGTCLNEGCVPVKALLRGTPSGKIVSQLREGILFLFKKNKITLIEGKARLLKENRIVVEPAQREVTAEFIVLATGSRPKPLPGLEFDGKRIISSTDAVNLGEVPKSITIIGGGAIGVEFATLFRNSGSEVTLVEMMEQMLPQEDEEIATGLERILKKKGIEIKTGTKVELPKDITDDRVLVAVGRVPNTEVYPAPACRGGIKVDSMMRTSQENIFAVGDLIGPPMFAHTAYQEAIVAAECICGLSPETIDYLNIPRVVYGDVEVASIGFTEREAREKGYKIKVSKHFFKANSRSVINQQTEGFIKIVADSETHKFLGVHILGREAAEIIHPFIVAKTAGISVEEVGRMVFAHPTVSEAVKAVCGVTT